MSKDDLPSKDKDQCVEERCDKGIACLGGGDYHTPPLIKQN